MYLAHSILIRIFDPVEEESGMWRFWVSFELYNLFKELNIIVEAKAQRLWWIGYVVRMRDNELSKRIIDTRKANVFVKSLEKDGSCYNRSEGPQCSDLEDEGEMQR